MDVSVAILAQVAQVAAPSIQGTPQFSESLLLQMSQMPYKAWLIPEPVYTHVQRMYEALDDVKTIMTIVAKQNLDEMYSVIKPYVDEVKFRALESYEEAKEYVESLIQEQIQVITKQVMECVNAGREFLLATRKLLYSIIEDYVNLFQVLTDRKKLCEATVEFIKANLTQCLKFNGHLDPGLMGELTAVVSSSATEFWNQAMNEYHNNAYLHTQ